MSQEPAERIWRIPCYVKDEQGQYIADQQAVAIAMGEAQAILFRLGGVIQIGTVREDVVEPDGFKLTITTMMIIRHQRFVPKVEPSAPAAPAPEEELATA